MSANDGKSPYSELTAVGNLQITRISSRRLRELDSQPEICTKRKMKSSTLFIVLLAIFFVTYARFSAGFPSRLGKAQSLVETQRDSVPEAFDGSGGAYIHYFCLTQHFLQSFGSQSDMKTSTIEIGNVTYIQKLAWEI